MGGPGFILLGLGLTVGSTIIGTAVNMAEEREAKRKIEPESDLRKEDNNPHRAVVVSPPRKTVALERVRDVQGRNLVGKQAARLAALQANVQTVQFEAQQPQQIPVLDAHEAFTRWITSAVTITNNEYDNIKSMNLIMSYVKYCESNGFQQLDANIFLEGMVMHANSMGYVLVESEDGWVLVHGVLNES